jgi:transposase
VAGHNLFFLWSRTLLPDSCFASEPEWAAFLAIDWADQKHAWSLEVPGAGKRERGECAASPEAVEAWIGELSARFAGRPIAVCVEQSRGLLFSLSKYENLVLYPIHPAAAKDFRKAVYPSGSKDDPLDADVLLDFLLKHRDRLRVWRPDTAETRELQFLVEDRRRLVDQKTCCLQQLTQRLKLYFPQALTWFGGADSVLLWKVLEQWPDWERLRKVDGSRLKSFLESDRRCSVPEWEQFWPALQQAVPATRDAAVIGSSVLFVSALVRQLLALRAAIQQYEKRLRELTETHPEFAIVKSFPGVGEALAPRLIAALGTQRERFASASELQSYSGIAPVKEASGKRCWVHMRWACPKFLRQTFQEWAQHSLGRSAWARAYYHRQKARGRQHHAIIRSLAFKWVRILFRCWQNRTPYDESHYQTALDRRCSLSPEPAVEFMWKHVAGFSKIAAARP